MEHRWLLHGLILPDGGTASRTPVTKPIYRRYETIE